MKAHHWDTDAPSVMDLIREGFGGLIAPLRRLWFVVSGRRNKSILLMRDWLDAQAAYESARIILSERYKKAVRQKKARAEIAGDLSHVTRYAIHCQREAQALRSQLQSYGEG